MSNTHTVTAIARMISDQTGMEVSPRVLTDLLYKRVLDVRRCPLVGDRRLIPVEYVPEIVRILEQRGLVSREEGGLRSRD